MHPLSFSTRLIVEVYEAIDVMIFIRKTTWLDFCMLQCEAEVYFRPLHVVYVVNIYKRYASVGCFR